MTDKPLRTLESLVADARASMPTREESDRRFEARVSGGQAWNDRHLAGPADIAGRGPGAEPERINVVSLPAWLALAERAGVSLIPIRPLAELSVRDYYTVLDQRDDGGMTVAFENAVVAGLQEGEVLRFEQCAPSEIKFNLSSGGEIGNGTIMGHDGRPFPDIWSMRFLDTLFDLGEDKVRAYARPYIEPMTVPGTFEGAEGSWPLEFRVFIRDGNITGIANYYRQVHPDEPGLMEEADLRAAVNGTLRAAQRMLDTMQELNLGIGNRAMAPGTEEHGAAGWDSQDYTLDFLIAADGTPLFLEGGPAGLLFADPCAFLSDEPGPCGLEGVALSTRRPPIPFMTWFSDNPHSRPDMPS